MSEIKVCDICGKYIGENDKCRAFKVKEYKVPIWDINNKWLSIDVHDYCLKLLLTIKEKQIDRIIAENDITEELNNRLFAEEGEK